MTVSRLQGNVAVVTGAGSSGPGVGIGRASAVAMAREGAVAILVDRDRTSAEETRELILSTGGEAVVMECDVTDAAECGELATRVTEEYGQLDVLMNNVGVLGAGGSALEADLDDWDRVMAVNVKSMLQMARACLPAMIRQGRGSIVNVSSIAGLEGGHPNLAYATSKGAVVQLTRALAADHGRDGVRVNCIAPGLVHTPMVAGDMTPEARDHRRRQSLLQTEGTAWDVACAAVFFASAESSWITGVVLPVDGGASAANPTRYG